MPGWRAIGVWLAALVAAVGLSSAAVTIATDQVTAPDPVAVIAAASARDAAGDASPTPLASLPSTDGADAATTSPGTTPSLPPSDAASAAPGTSDTATTRDGGANDGSVASEQTRTAVAAGGTARFGFVGERVELVFATPARGFATDVERSGTETVRVWFTSDSHASRVVARVEDGAPRVTVEEERREPEPEEPREDERDEPRDEQPDEPRQEQPEEPEEPEEDERDEEDDEDEEDD